jgi:hypothetical protein
VNWRSHVGRPKAFFYRHHPADLVRLALRQEPLIVSVENLKLFTRLHRVDDWSPYVWLCVNWRSHVGRPKFSKDTFSTFSEFRVWGRLGLGGDGVEQVGQGSKVFSNVGEQLILFGRASGTLLRRLRTQNSTSGTKEKP